MRKMRDSGIEWIGEIPEEWSLTRLRFLGELNSSGVDKKIRDGETIYRSIHYVDVYRNGLKEFEYNDDLLEVSATTEKANECKVKTGDVLFTNSSETADDIGHSTVILKYKDNILFGYHLMRFRPTIIMYVKYEKYLFGSSYLRRWFEYNANGITRYGINYNVFADALVLLPTFNEQKLIADYLDKKCTEIDSVIKAKETTNLKIKEYRQSVIYEAVTKGLDKNVPLKDSGIEWIGEIPKEWETSRIGRHCTLKTGSTPPTSQEQYFDGDINWYTPSDFNSEYKLISSDRNLSVLAIKNNIITLFPKHSILIVAIGATIGKVGYISEEAYCNQQITAIIADNIYYKFLLYFMIASSKYIKDNALYTTLPIINNAYLKDIPLVLPKSSEEQQQIADYLDKKCTEIDSVISANETTIQKLKEYRQSVIYEAVTGKKEI